MWNIEWDVSTIKHKATFEKYGDAIEYLERVIKDFGKTYMIEIRMWKGE